VKQEATQHDAHIWAARQWPNASTRTGGGTKYIGQLDGPNFYVWGEGQTWDAALAMAKDRVENVGREKCMMQFPGDD